MYYFTLYILSLIWFNFFIRHPQSLFVIMYAVNYNYIEFLCGNSYSQFYKFTRNLIIKFKLNWTFINSCCSLIWRNIFCTMLTETTGRMREKGQTGGDGPPFRVRLSTFNGRNTVIASRSHGSCFRGWHVGRNQSVICTAHEINSRLVLSRGWRTWATDWYGTTLAIVLHK